MRIKILQWNILYYEDVNKIISVIKKANPDIVCLQEATKGSKWNRGINVAHKIASKFGFSFYFPLIQKFIKEYSTGWLGNCILSKFPIQVQKNIILQNGIRNSKDFSKQTRGYIEIKVKHNDGELTVGAAHLSYSHRFIHTKERKKETSKLIKVLKTKKNRFIFMGDLNAMPNSYTIKQIRRYLTNCGPDFSQKTWTTKLFQHQNFKTSKLNWRLDYVFATKDIKVKSAKVIKTKVSDHLPILVEIEI